MKEDEAISLVDSAVNTLREHFEHVQILVSWENVDTGNTMDLFRGKGNWYSRVGMAKEFLNRDQGQVTAKEIADKLSPPEDE